MFCRDCSKPARTFDSPPPGMCLNASGQAFRVPSSAGKHRSHLTRLVQHPPPTAAPAPPRGVCTRASTAACTFPKQEAAPGQEGTGFGFPEGVPGPQRRSRTPKKGPSVRRGPRERASIPAHVCLGPRKNPQLVTLSSATPASVTFLPFLSPHWVAPANQLPHLPPSGRETSARPSWGRRQAQVRAAPRA